MLRLLFIVTLSVFAIGCSSGEPESPVEKPSADAPRLGAEFETIPETLQLTGPETATFQANLNAHNDNLRTWMQGEKGLRLVVLETDIRARTKGKDLPGLRATIAEAKPLRDEMIALIQSSRESLLNALGSERRMQWESHEVSSTLLDLMGPLALDAAQVARIEQEAVQQMRAAQSRNELNPKAASFLALERVAEKGVLSPNQQAAYESIKKDHPMRSLGI